MAVDVGEPQLRAPGCGCSLRTMTAFPWARRTSRACWCFRDPRAEADLPVTVIGRGPRLGGDVQYGVLDVVGDGESGGVRQPPARGGQPVEEPVGAAAGSRRGSGPGGAVASGPAWWRRCARWRCSIRRSPGGAGTRAAHRALGAAISEHGQGIESEGPLPGGRGLVLL